MRSPANSSTAGTRTPGTWTPTILSPRSPAVPSYPNSSSHNPPHSGSVAGSAYPLSSGALSAAAAASASKGARAGGAGRGSGFGYAVGSMFGLGPVEEGAVREALGLLPSGGVDGEEGHRRLDDRREHYGSGNAGGNGGGSSGYGYGYGSDGEREESGGRARRFRRTNQAPGAAPLCLLLRNLGELFRWDAAAAADICADAFPGVRPW